MQIFARSIPLWGLKVITRPNFGSLIQQKHCILIGPHEEMDLAKIWISKMVYWAGYLFQSCCDKWGIEEEF